MTDLNAYDRAFLSQGLSDADALSEGLIDIDAVDEFSSYNPERDWYEMNDWFYPTPPIWEPKKTEVKSVTSHQSPVNNY